MQGYLAHFIKIIIYELVTRGFTVFAGKTHKGEIDFVAIKGGKKCLSLVFVVNAMEAGLFL